MYTNVVSTIDFITKTGNRSIGLSKRLTANITDGKFYITNKINKTNLDYMHQRVDQRISGAIEETTEISREEFKNEYKKGLFMARIKYRHQFRFQFWVYEFTKVYELKDQPIIKKIQFLLNKEYDSESMNSVLIQALKDVPETLETEIEICDEDYQIGLYKQSKEQFDRAVMRFIRNAEMFFQFKYEGYFEDYRQLFENLEKIEKIENNSASKDPRVVDKKEDNIAIQYPIIGGKYLDSIKKIKLI